MKQVDGWKSDLLNKTFRKLNNIVSRKVAGELFLIPIRGNLADMQQIFTLNPVAEYIWQELDNKNLSEVCNDVIAAFDVKKEQAESDIQELIGELLKAGLISEQV